MRDKTSLHDVEIQKFIIGYKKFRAHYFSATKKNVLYQKLVQEGQSPTTMVITCSDARVDPSIILNVLPGELFVVRNVANLVPPYDNDPKHHGTSAALEFAVQSLQVQHIIILAHSDCGGIETLLKPTHSVANKNQHSFVASWMNIAAAAKEKILTHYHDASFEEQARLCEEESLLISLQNLHTFPWIEKKVIAGHLSLHAWRFDLHTGIIKRFNTELKKFEAL